MNYVYMSDIYDTYEYPDYLAHHGILGMKWGVRRYQNEDGSLTSAGRTHYGIGDKLKDYARSATRSASAAANKSLAGLGVEAAMRGTIAKNKFDRSRLNAKLKFNEMYEKGDSIAGGKYDKVRGRLTKSNLSRDFQDALLNAGVKREGFNKKMSSKAQDALLNLGIKGETSLNKLLSSDSYKTLSSKGQDFVLNSAIKGQDAYKKFSSLSQDAALNAAVKAIDIGNQFTSKSQYASYRMNHDIRKFSYNVQNKAKSAAVTASLTSSLAGSAFTSSFSDYSASLLKNNLTTSSPISTSFSKAQSRVNTQKYNYAFEKARVTNPDTWQSKFKY